MEGALKMSHLKKAFLLATRHRHTALAEAKTAAMIISDVNRQGPLTERAHQALYNLPAASLSLRLAVWLKRQIGEIREKH